MKNNLFPSKYREQLANAIVACIRAELQPFQDLPWGNQVTEQLIAFCVGGKLLRGTTFVHVAHLLSDALPKKSRLADDTILAIGVAIELFGSAILIHDDVIDRDVLRRGKDTIHTQFKKWATTYNRRTPDHDGNSAAIILGDILLFLVNRPILRLTDPAFDKTTIQAVLLQFSRDSLFTAFGELADSVGDPSQTQLLEKDILELYCTKTAHYTFGMPLAMAAIASNQSAEQVKVWEKIGEYLGTLFQIKDDELGLFGDQNVTGKAVGADIRENKRTLYFLYTQNALLRANQKKQLSVLEHAYGNPHLTQTEILAVTELMEETGARQLLIDRMHSLAAEASTLLRTLQPSQPVQSWFSTLVDFSISRTK